MQIEVFDVMPELHEANLLAYLNLLAIIVEESCKLVHALCTVGDMQASRNHYEGINQVRAAAIADSTFGAKQILRDFGLWHL